MRDCGGEKGCCGARTMESDEEERSATGDVARRE
jgi:hypothetical protein